MGTHRRLFAGLALVLLALALTGCAAGDTRFDRAPAGFFTGLWHGFICVITLVIGWFHDGVEIYERSNSGGWYDAGLVLGASIFFGGTGVSSRRKRKKKDKGGVHIRIDASAGDGACEDDDAGDRIEAKIKAGIRSWLDEEDRDDDEWGDIARKIEDKVKRDLRDWAEE